MGAPRSLALTAGVLLSCTALLAFIGTAFVPAPQLAQPSAAVAAPAGGGLPAAAISAAALAVPTAAHADEGSIWIPALSAVGAGFAIGLAAIGS
eukprot:CAMPEP_0197909134 /NCGR_PEP_ID=MMETSP1439-20131203/68265_1 /TAXON_ID=66791 /ORGANISM="Gonyaulax spinifera, Strain CCMP409" /LENGTH=93 /DNA_ID=CAMNT_0043530683 /DNA_START=75 /DNA_END=353 /DNA_ORIENTATION=+